MLYKVKDGKYKNILFDQCTRDEDGNTCLSFKKYISEIYFNDSSKLITLDMEYKPFERVINLVSYFCIKEKTYKFWKYHTNLYNP